VFEQPNGTSRLEAYYNKGIDQLNTPGTWPRSLTLHKAISIFRSAALIGFGCSNPQSVSA
jgi:hypothetical protein